MSAATILQHLEECARLLDADYNELEGEGPETLVHLLIGVRKASRELTAFGQRIERDVIANAGEKRFAVDGIGEVEIRPNPKRTNWDNAELTKVLVARALDERALNEGTGEYEPAHEAVARVLTACARPSWRVTPLRERGIQVDEFCTETLDAYSVQLPAGSTR